MMKSSISLLLLSAGMAFAQSPDSLRRRDDARVEGAYQSLQRDDTIRRTLTLDRDGKVVLFTEFRGSRGERKKWDRDDSKKYGKVAEDAADGKSLRHQGRWTMRGDRIVLRMDSLPSARGGRREVELELDRRDNGLVFEKDNDYYGNNKITFRWDGGRNPSRGSRFGSVRFDADEFDIDGVDLTERGIDSRLVIRAGNRRIELRGESTRRGNRVTFKLPYERNDGGEYILEMKGTVVDSISGHGAQDRHRIDIHEGSVRRG